jgi:hypothetical protein
MPTQSQDRESAFGFALLKQAAEMQAKKNKKEQRYGNYTNTNVYRKVS